MQRRPAIRRGFLDFKSPDLQRRNAPQSMYRFQLSVNLIIKIISMIIFNTKSSSCSQLSRIFFSYDVNIFHHVHVLTCKDQKLYQGP